MNEWNLEKVKAWFRKKMGVMSYPVDDEFWRTRLQIKTIGDWYVEYIVIIRLRGSNRMWKKGFASPCAAWEYMFKMQSRLIYDFKKKGKN